MNLSPHFTLAEMTVTQLIRRGFSNSPNAEEIENLRRLCVNVLEPLRLELGPVVINSGFRSEAVNRAVGGVSSSQHRLGQAADIIVPGHTIAFVIATIRRLKLPFDQVIDEWSAWTHVSYGPRNRRELLRARTVGGQTNYTSIQP